MTNNNKLLIICGPTGTGKTQLAVELAKKFNGELVSADSRQVYRGMDIGTGKDRAKIDVPISLLDVVNPDEEFSVSAWAKLAHQAITDILSRNKLPIVVGGTGLYIHALIYPPETMDIPPDKKLREKLQDVSVGSLQEMVKPAILQSMNQSDRQNPRRLIRKIEVALHQSAHLSFLTKSRLSRELSKDTVGQKGSYDVLQIGLTASLQDLYKKIDRRAEARLSKGIIQEVSDLLAKGYSWNLPSMSGLGYIQWKSYFERKPEDDEKIFKDSAVQEWKHAEHKYAKRQLTWFHKNKEIDWFDITSKDYRNEVTRTVLAWYTGGADEHKN